MLVRQTDIPTPRLMSLVALSCTFTVVIKNVDTLTKLWETLCPGCLLIQLLFCPSKNFECCEPKYSDSRGEITSLDVWVGDALFSIWSLWNARWRFSLTAKLMCQTSLCLSLHQPVSSTSCVASRLFCETKFVSFSSDQGHLVYLLYCFGSCLSWLSLDLPNFLCLLFKGSLKEVSTADICSNIVQPLLCLN